MNCFNIRHFKASLPSLVTIISVFGALEEQQFRSLTANKPDSRQITGSAPTLTLIVVWPSDIVGTVMWALQSQWCWYQLKSYLFSGPHRGPPHPLGLRIQQEQPNPSFAQLWLLALREKPSSQLAKQDIVNMTVYPCETTAFLPAFPRNSWNAPPFSRCCNMGELPCLFSMS